MDDSVVCSRRLQFCAGPWTLMFHACERHREKLERGDVSCFLKLKDEPVREFAGDEEDEECDFCRES